MNTIKKISVIDVETTGFKDSDRICEIAIVDIDPNTLEITGQYETLINPNRDMGATHIHGITSDMVKDSPLFEDIADEIADNLNNSIFIAHNVSFDLRMLRNEFERAGFKINAGNTKCTLQMSKNQHIRNLKDHKLPSVANALNIECKNHHGALNDAVACAQIFQKLNKGYGVEKLTPMSITKVELKSGSYILPREISLLRQKNGELPNYITENVKIVNYLERLDAALYDLKISEEEDEDLKNLAISSGLDKKNIDIANHAYMQSLIEGVKADHIVTKDEHGIMTSVAEMLQIASSDIPEETNQKEAVKGTRVCFSGTDLDKEELGLVASRKGYVVVNSTTKSGCDLLVVSDVSSLTGKAKTARKFNIPIMSVEDFET